MTWMLALLLAQPAQAEFFDGQTGVPVSSEEIVQTVQCAGCVLVFGEIHNNETHHFNQEQLLSQLKSFSVGMEFFEYPQQPTVDRFLNEEISEEEFLEEISWGGFPYDMYRNIVEAPLAVGGWTYAINAPRSITSQVAKGGLNSLTEDQAAQLPPDFELGNDTYYARFKEAMSHGHELPEEMVRNYFAAQSIWDDTMAWQSMLVQNPDELFVIIVGDFHAAYGGGLPDRLRARGVEKVFTISQTTNPDQVEPHDEWGVRADWVWAP